MTERHLELIAAESERLIALAAADGELRTALRAIAERILAATSETLRFQPDEISDRAELSPPIPVADALQDAARVDLSEPVAGIDQTIAFAPPASVVVASDEPVAPPTVLAPALPEAGSSRMTARTKPDGEPLRELKLGSPPATRKPASTPLRELTLGGRPSSSKPVPAPLFSMPGSKLSEELARLADRCRLKADAARRAARRIRQFHETLADPLDDPPALPEFADWADRLTDDLYFGDHFDVVDMSGITRLETLAGCFEALASALLLAHHNQNHTKRLERALPLFAEAQSALRAAMRAFRDIDDPDQREAFDWLKDAASRYQTYIKRFMRLDDQADPAQWPDLLERIKKISTKQKTITISAAAGVSRLESVSTAIDRLQKDTRDGAATSDAWQAVMIAVDDQVRDGLPPSNRELRDLLLPVINELPETADPPPGFRLVLREIDRFVDATTVSASHELTAHEPTAEVATAARLLGGRSVVLIGGNRRPMAEDALRRAFGLQELVWIETKEHQSVSTFEPLVSRGDVALVLLAIRWSSHSFGDVKQLCDLHAKPLVRLPGGYSPNQVAAQVVAQSSDQLASD